MSPEADDIDTNIKKKYRKLNSLGSILYGDI